MPSKRTIALGAVAAGAVAAGEIASSFSIGCPIASDGWAFMEAAFVHNSSACLWGIRNRSHQATESEIAMRTQLERAAPQQAPSPFQVALAMSDICGELDEVFRISPR